MAKGSELPAVLLKSVENSFLLRVPSRNQEGQWEAALLAGVFCSDLGSVPGAVSLGTWVMLEPRLILELQPANLQDSSEQGSDPECKAYSVPLLPVLPSVTGTQPPSRLPRCSLDLLCSSHTGGLPFAPSTQG